MSPEMITIIAVGVALAGLVLRGQHGLGKRVEELRQNIDGLRKDIAGLDTRLRAVETGLAELRGRFDGMDGQLAFLRDYITGRNERAGEPVESGADE